MIRFNQEIQDKFTTIFQELLKDIRNYCQKINEEIDFLNKHENDDEAENAKLIIQLNNNMQYEDKIHDKLSNLLKVISDEEKSLIIKYLNKGFEKRESNLNTNKFVLNKDEIKTELELIKITKGVIDDLKTDEINKDSTINENRLNNLNFNITKFKTNLNTEQFAYFLRLLTEEGILILDKRGDKAEFIRFITANFETSTTKELNETTFTKRYQYSTQSAIDALYKKISHLLKQVGVDKNNLEK